MDIRYKPDALHPDYKTVRLDDNLGEDMTDQKRRIEDKLPTEPLRWDEDSATDEILSLHRQLAAEKLRADQGWQRAEAKSKECIDLRERQAAPLASQSQAAQPSKHTDLAQRLRWMAPHQSSDGMKRVLTQAADEIDRLAGQSQATLEDSEQYRLQMAAISTAALGYWTEEEGIKPEYDTVPLRDVARLYAKYAALHSSQATKVQAVPVAYLRYWARQSWSGNGNHDIDHGEGLEVCDAGEVGDDGVPAFPVYAAPTAQEVTQQAAKTESEAPAILEAISWHAGERDDLTLEQAVEAFRFGYKKVRQREDRAMLLQLIHLMASAPVSAAKAETAEQAEGEQANVLPPTRGTESQHSASVAALTDEEIDAITVKHSTYLGGWEWSGDIIDIGAGREHDFAREVEAEVTRRFRAQGGNTNTESSDLAPTTSTVSAPDEQDDPTLNETPEMARLRLVVEQAKIKADAKPYGTRGWKAAERAYGDALIAYGEAVAKRDWRPAPESHLRTVSASGSADTGSAA
jgi:hypothetical protein